MEEMTKCLGNVESTKDKTEAGEGKHIDFFLAGAGVISEKMSSCVG